MLSAALPTAFPMDLLESESTAPASPTEPLESPTPAVQETKKKASKKRAREEEEGAKTESSDEEKGEKGEKGEEEGEDGDKEPVRKNAPQWFREKTDQICKDLWKVIPVEYKEKPKKAKKAPAEGEEAPKEEPKPPRNPQGPLLMMSNTQRAMYDDLKKVLNALSDTLASIHETHGKVGISQLIGACRLYVADFTPTTDDEEELSVSYMDFLRQFLSMSKSGMKKDPNVMPMFRIVDSFINCITRHRVRDMFLLVAHGGAKMTVSKNDKMWLSETVYAKLVQHKKAYTRISHLL